MSASAWVSESVAGQALGFRANVGFGRVALVNGTPEIVIAPGGRVLAVAAFTVAGGQIVAIDVVADPEKLRGLTVS